MSLKGTDSISLRKWVADLNYDEVHAFTIGFVVWALYGFTTSEILMTAGIGLILASVGQAKLKNKTLRYILREPHYLQGGAVIGLLVGLAVGALV